MRGQFRRFRNFTKALTTSALGCVFATTAYSVTQYKPAKVPFMYDITNFSSSLTLPLRDEVETIKPSTAKMQARLKKAPKDVTVEPLTLTLSNDEAQIIAMAEKIAAPGKGDALATYLHGAWRHGQPIQKGSNIRTVDIDKTGFAMMDAEAFADIYNRVHHKLTIDGKELRENSRASKELVDQLSPFLGAKELYNLEKKIKIGRPIEVDRSVLPAFAAKMVGKYIIYRGPNCFHAALAFQSPKLTSSNLINVKEEKGYHRAMINFDELWRVINTDFYEINPEKVPLKYGDMLVLFDVPKDSDMANGPVDFRWIRHAATYLFGGYTFSKGSKSPNTPYTIRTLSEEWSTWKRYTQNLGIKVFRRSEKNVTSRPPMDLADWIY